LQQDVEDGHVDFRLKGRQDLVGRFFDISTPILFGWRYDLDECDQEVSAHVTYRQASP